MSTTTHGSNDACPDVKSGKTTRCMGHESSDALPQLTKEDAERLRDIAISLREICPEDMDAEGKWLMAWVNDRTPPASAPRTLESDIREDRMKRRHPPMPALQVERDSKEHLWRCVYCGDEVDRATTPCMKPKCVDARLASERRMGIKRDA